MNQNHAKEICGKITDTDPVMEFGANVSPELIRYSLKGLSKSICVDRILDMIKQFYFRRNATRALEFTLECILLKKRSEFQSVKSVVESNENEIREERDVLLAFDRKNHFESSEMAGTYGKNKFLEILMDQKRMIEVNDTLNEIRRYNEDELNAAMDEFKHLIAAKLQDVSVQAELLLSEREHGVVSSFKDMREEFDHLRIYYKTMKRDQSVEIKLLEEEIRRMIEKPKREHFTFK